LDPFITSPVTTPTATLISRSVEELGQALERRVAIAVPAGLKEGHEEASPIVTGTNREW
jgi:hypothetical protein